MKFISNILSKPEFIVPEEDVPTGPKTLDHVPQLQNQLEKRACKVFDHWSQKHPNAVDFRKIIIELTWNGTFIYYPDAGSMSKDIKEVCGSQIKDVVEITNQLREALPYEALPFKTTIEVEPILRNQGRYHRVDTAITTIAGLLMSRSGDGVPSILKKINIIDHYSQAPGKSQEWDVFQTPMGYEHDESAANKPPTYLYTITAGSQRAAYLKAASMHILTHEVGALVREGRVNPKSKATLSRLHLSLRQPSAWSYLELTAPEA